jgi:hypothetical protein
MPNLSNAEVSDEEISEAAIDRTLADSFPASDPPSWTLGVKKTRKKFPSDDSVPRAKPE